MVDSKSIVLVAALLCITAAASLCAGSDLITRDGAVYRNAQVIGIDPDGLRVSHSNGVAKLRFEELPEDLQRRYNYDAAKVSAYRKQQLEMERAAAQRKAEAEQQRERELQNIAALQKKDADRRAEESRRQKLAAARTQKLEYAGQYVLLVTGLLASVAIYFLPAIVGRRKANAGAIFVLNFFLGWTFVGWVIALVWACTKEIRAD